jgi:hypothetical protein
LERSLSQQGGKVSCGDNCVYQKHKTDSSIFLKTHLNIPDFQRDFTEILETVLSSQNFACHFDDNTEDILDSRLWENILDRKTPRWNFKASSFSPASK